MVSRLPTEQKIPFGVPPWVNLKAEGRTEDTPFKEEERKGSHAVGLKPASARGARHVALGTWR